MEVQKMAYRIQDMLYKLSLSELEEIRSFLDVLIKEKAQQEREN
jgi:hypothetical protein